MVLRLIMFYVHFVIWIETINHLFLSCRMMSDLWSLMGRWWDLDFPVSRLSLNGSRRLILFDYHSIWKDAWKQLFLLCFGRFGRFEIGCCSQKSNLSRRRFGTSFDLKHSFRLISSVLSLMLNKFIGCKILCM